MDPIVAAVAVALAIAVAVGLVAMRKKAPAAQPPDPAPASARPPVSPGPAASPVAAAPAAPAKPITVPPVQEASAPAELDKVSCTYNSAVHGAMPPFGKLSCADGVVVFEATSRVVTKAGGLGEDGSSTLQSLGAIEMGRFRFEIAPSTVQRVDFSPNRATVHADSGIYQFEGLANCGPQLKPWFGAQGLAD
ncbi:MAG: hypothetical protein FJ100_03065 [Deltaproteobacteria bacterium]|nr:hypothetical protein [Deltaproteobacteria bacterium]